MKIGGYLSLAFAFAAAVVRADAPLVEGRVVKLTRESEIFEKASGRSKVVADADKGTVLILRKLSPKRNWLFVEDEDQNQGWVPRNRTDFALLVRRDDPLEPEPTKIETTPSGLQVEEERVSRDDARPELPSAWYHGLAAVGRKSLYDTNGKWAAGGQYSLLTPARIAARRAYRVGFLTGFLRSFDEGATVPFRFRLLAGSPSSSWSTGPDLGLLWMRRADAEINWSWGLGYTVQVHPLNLNRFYFGLRMGLEFLHGTRFSYELSVGYFL